MKRFNLQFSLLALFLLLATTATATTITAWSGTKQFSSWSDVVNITGSKFSKVQEGDIVRFLIEASDGAQFQVSYGSNWTNFPDLGAKSVSGNYDLLVTQAMVSQLKQGIHVKGINYTLKGVNLLQLNADYTTAAENLLSWDDLFTSGGQKSDQLLVMDAYGGAGWYWPETVDLSGYSRLEVTFQIPTDQPLIFQVLYGESSARRATIPAGSESYVLSLTSAMKDAYSVSFLSQKAQTIALSSVNILDKDGNAVYTAIHDIAASSAKSSAVERFDLSGRRTTRAHGMTIVRERLSDGSYRTSKVMLPCPAWQSPVNDAAIDAQPCDPDANAETRALYAYLRDEIWGKKCLSGCQAEWNYNINDAETIYKAGGKYPKVNIFDFQHFDQSWINYRSTVARDWHRAGGIVGFMWHIHMPCNAFAEGLSGWTSFYTNGNPPCHFSAERSATEGTLENRLFVKKLDGVASLLLLYQSWGIPIIWRPYHEAWGRWFWWGTDGAEASVKLWRYTFDYFAEKGIHNLLWVWTGNGDDSAWYPGDEYVDIVAYDGYPENNTTHISQVSTYQSIRKGYPTKMAAMAECNSVPSWENMQKDGAIWLYVAPWCGGGALDHGNDATFWKSFLSNENIVTR